MPPACRRPSPARADIFYPLFEQQDDSMTKLRWGRGGEVAFVQDDRKYVEVQAGPVSRS